MDSMSSSMQPDSEHESGCEHPTGDCCDAGISGPCAESACDGPVATGTASPEAQTKLPRQVQEQVWRAVPAAEERLRSVRFPAAPEKIHRRWDRLVRLLGMDGVRRMQATHVAVFGLGGVGSYLVEALARSAVGRLTLVDFDDVCVTNLNRQLQAFPETVGRSKAMLLAERVRAINPEAYVDPVQAFFEVATAEALLTPRPDIVVDAIDNVTSKVYLLERCTRSRIPVISVTGAGARLDPSRIRIDDLSRTRVDPLARVLRKELSRRGIGTDGDAGIPVVFSDEEVLQPEVPEWDLESGFRCICPHREDSPHACEKRRTIYGTAAFMTAAFGMVAAGWVVRQASGRQNSSRPDARAAQAGQSAQQNDSEVAPESQQGF